MKVVILAGGFGTRISEESQFKPKPMVELGGMPILWHIMKLYSHYGYNDFIICAGYKQHVIKEYFADYFLHISDITYDFTSGKNEMTVHANLEHPSTVNMWTITLRCFGVQALTMMEGPLAFVYRVHVGGLCDRGQPGGPNYAPVGRHRWRCPPRPQTVSRRRQKGPPGSPGMGGR